VNGTPFEADLHVHTHHSADGHGDPREAVMAAERSGLFAIAITDHNTVQGSREAAGVARGRDILVVPGQEVSTFNGHVLALGVTEPIPYHLSADETIRRIEDHGGLAVAAHPGRLYSGLSVHEVRAAAFPAVEAANGHSSVRQNQAAMRLAKDMGVGVTGGSDAHWPGEIGGCRTVFTELPTSVEELLEAIRDRRTRVMGEGLGTAEQAGLNVRMLGRWLKRGARRI
jgi:predicted metal-dependent phosphoesterase TrpH